MWGEVFGEGLDVIQGSRLIGVFGAFQGEDAGKGDGGIFEAVG